MKSTMMSAIALFLASSASAGEIPVSQPESVGMSGEGLERLAAATQEFNYPQFGMTFRANRSSES